ncbi:MAG: Hsp20/alpha crystallin family protein [Acidobacteriota bacterium]
MADRYTALLLVGRLQARLDRVFQEVSESLAGGIEVPDWQPAVDVIETADAVLLLAEIPGMSATEITIEVSGNVVVLRGEKASAALAERGHFLCVETGRGRFQREVQLLHPVNSHRGRAVLRDGVLSVEFPRIQDLREQPRTVTVDTVDDQEI